jgi:hypothetical protein
MKWMGGSAKRQCDRALDYLAGRVLCIRRDGARRPGHVEELGVLPGGAGNVLVW